MKNKLALIAPLCGLLLCAFAIKSRPVYVVFIGDSITHGSKFPDQAPPVYAGKYLDREYRPGGVQISNQGVSGRTTYEFLPGTPLFRKVRAVADSFYRDTNGILVFSIMIGTNDSAIKGPKGAPVSP
jgi:lysophospholipase L1-like esterase